ncbi:MAG: hypothetical protein ABR502_08650, partial [Chitinophagaceae bacterium]
MAIAVASFRFFTGDENIFSRMVIGKADDPYDSIRYVMVGSAERAGFTSKEGFQNYIGGYGYKKSDSAQAPDVILTENANLDSVRTIQTIYPNTNVFTYKSIQRRLTKKADGIIETCKSAVN